MLGLTRFDIPVCSIFCACDSTSTLAWAMVRLSVSNTSIPDRSTPSDSVPESKAQHDDML